MEELRKAKLIAKPQTERGCFIMYSVIYTLFWFLFGWDRCHKASEEKTIMAPRLLHEKNDISQEHARARQSLWGEL